MTDVVTLGELTEEAVRLDEAAAAAGGNALQVAMVKSSAADLRASMAAPWVCLVCRSHFAFGKVRMMFGACGYPVCGHGLICSAERKTVQADPGYEVSGETMH